MRIGLVGKPNVGKSTAFAALTETPVEIANYPFTTIDANVGVAWLPLPDPCACDELRKRREADGRLDPPAADDPREGSLCEPRSGSCNGHRRFAPVTLVDVAGLVPGAHEGRGRGNQFLSDLAACDALIQIVDASGATDLEGNPSGPGACDPLEEHRFLIGELDAWIAGLLWSSWSRGARRSQSEGEGALNTYLHDQLTGLGASVPLVSNALAEFRSERADLGVPWSWPEELVMELASAIRRQLFPVHVAANKADAADSSTWSSLAEAAAEEGALVRATSADSELALRRASSAGAIDYSPGGKSFSIAEGSDLSEAQRKGLAALQARLDALGDTGIVGLLADVVFGPLDRIVAYPVQDEGKWTDGDGRILPDALLVPRGTTARGLAYAVHTDLGDGFIRATDGRSGRVIGGDHELADADVVKIHAKT